MSWLSSADEILIVMPILVGALSRSERWLKIQRMYKSYTQHGEIVRISTVQD